MEKDCMNCKHYHDFQELTLGGVYCEEYEVTICAAGEEIYESSECDKFEKIQSEENEILKPCPFCGGIVTIALTGDDERQNYFITRGRGKDKCTCRVFMESEQFYADDDNETKLKAKNELIERWNNRV